MTAKARWLKRVKPSSDAKRVHVTLQQKRKDKKPKNDYARSNTSHKILQQTQCGQWRFIAGQYRRSGRLAGS